MVAAGLVLLALLAGIAGTTYGLIRAEAQREKAVAAQQAEAEQRARAVVERDRALAAERQTGVERDRAVAAESRATAINEFLTQDLLTQAEPAKNAVEDHVTLVEVLDRAAANVGRRFADQPELEGGPASRRSPAPTMAWPSGRRPRPSGGRCWRRRGSADPQSAESYRALGGLANILGPRGRHDAEVTKMAESAAEGLGRTLGPDHPSTLTALDNLAGAYLAAGKVPEAIALLSGSATPGSPGSAPTTPTP